MVSPIQLWLEMHNADLKKNAKMATLQTMSCYQNNSFKTTTKSLCQVKSQVSCVRFGSGSWQQNRQSLLSNETDITHSLQWNPYIIRPCFFQISGPSPPGTNYTNTWLDIYGSLCTFVWFDIITSHKTCLLFVPNILATSHGHHQQTEFTTGVSYDVVQTSF